MELFYRILSTVPLSDSTSLVIVEVTPGAPINGFHGEVIQFEAPNATLKEMVIERARWKMKTETRIDVEPKHVRPFSRVL